MMTDTHHSPAGQGPDAKAPKVVQLLTLYRPLSNLRYGIKSQTERRSFFSHFGRAFFVRLSACSAEPFIQLSTT